MFRPRRAGVWLVVATLAILWVLGGLMLRTSAQPVSSSAPSASPPASAAASASASAKPSAPAPSSAPGGPREVKVGVYVNQVHELKLRDNTFLVDLYVWFRWLGDDLKPYETYAFVDGRIDSKGELTQKKLPDGQSYAYQRVVVRITKFFNPRHYPLDSHLLRIIVEEEKDEGHLLRYVADSENSRVDPRVFFPGWTLAYFDTKAEMAAYKSNFGDTSLPTGKESHYTRFVASMSLRRTGIMFPLKVFFGLWVSAAIAFLVFFIKPTEVDPRFGLGVGAIFAAIASQYIISGALPDTNMITLADEMHIVAFGFIFLSLVQSTWSLHLYDTEREADSKRIDKIAKVLFPAVYVALNAFFLLRA